MIPSRRFLPSMIVVWLLAMVAGILAAVAQNMGHHDLAATFNKKLKSLPYVLTNTKDGEENLNEKPREINGSEKNKKWRR